MPAGKMPKRRVEERDPAEIEAARRLFAGPCEFVAGAASIQSLPEFGRPEIAFAAAPMSANRAS